MNHSTWRPVALAAVLLALAGCGKQKGGLSGKVTLNGETLDAGQVTAFNEAGDVLALGPILDGEYRLSDMPLGPVTLVVQTYAPDGRPAGLAGSPPPPPGARPMPPEIVKDHDKDLPDAVRKAVESLKPVPLKYSNVKQSDLKVTVAKGETNFNIEMTGKGEIPRPPPPPPGQAGVPPPIILPRP
jgi:hypothetical protein